MSVLGVLWRRDEYYAKFEDGDEDLMMDLTFAVSEKSDTYNIRTDSAVLKAIMDKFESQTPTNILVLGKSGKMVSKSEIAYDELQLLLRCSESDLQALKVWQESCKNVEGIAYNARQRWTLKQDQNAEHAAGLFMSRKLYFEIWDTESANNSKNINHILDSRRDFGKRLGGVEAHCIPFVALWNMSAPTVFSVGIQKAQLSTISWTICDNLNSLGLVLMPVHHNQPSKRYLQESALLTKMSKINCSFDEMFSILLTDKSDKRDNRPMTYPGRFIFPSALSSPDKSIWYKCQLREDGRTESTKQLPAKDMIWPEDISEEAVPAANEEGRYLSGGPKYMQLAPATWEAIFTSVTNGVKLTEAGLNGVMFVSLSPDTGSDVTAFLKFIQGTNVQCAMTLFCDSQVHKDWLEHVITDDLKTLVKEKKLVVTGQVSIEDKMSDADMCVYPPLPQLHTLVPNTTSIKLPGAQESEGVLPKDLELRMPIAMVQKWALDPTHSQEFNTFMETMNIKSVEEGAGQKRAAQPLSGEPAGSEPEPPPKKLNVTVDPQLIVNSDTIKKALLCQTKVTGIKGNAVVLQIRADNCKVLVNTGSSQVLISLSLYIYI